VPCMEKRGSWTPSPGGLEEDDILPAMVDLAGILAARGQRVTVNAARNRAAVEAGSRAGLAIELVAIWKMAEPLEAYVWALPRRPDCLASPTHATRGRLVYARGSAYRGW
jgi:hypothetical protein